MAMVKGFDYDYEAVRYRTASGDEIKNAQSIDALMRRPYKIKVATDSYVVASRGYPPLNQYDDD